MSAATRGHPDRAQFRRFGPNDQILTTNYSAAGAAGLPARQRPLLVLSFVSPPVTRILSDIHYGDRASTVTDLRKLLPLTEGTAALVFNGDTLDTRHGGNPVATAALREEVAAFVRALGRPVTLLPGNHDPDISAQQCLELSARQIFVVHGDVLFEDIVPWSRDSALSGKRVAQEMASLTAAQRGDLSEVLRAYRRAGAAVPQRHQGETRWFNHLVGYARDTVWPPSRVLRILRAWREAPDRAAALLQRYALPARFFVMGHTHRLGVTRSGDGLWVLNTGTFSRFSGIGVVDVAADTVALRRVRRQGSDYHLADTIAEFALAPASGERTLAP